MRNLLLAGTLLAGLGAAAAPAEARLQLSITNGIQTFSCADGQLGCDLSGGANNLLTVDTTLGSFFVQLTLAQSTFGTHNVLQLSNANIENNGGIPGTLTFIASDTNFVPPASDILESGSLTFNNNVGAGASSISFFADPANGQGANPLNTPGTLLDSFSGTPATDPDSFSGTHLSAFAANSLFSMTESAHLNLIAGGSVTGFDQSMTSSAIPEPKTWAMLILGFGMMAFFGVKRARKDRLTFVA
jgi:PEP-CTERM motif-containing protein